MPYLLQSNKTRAFVKNEYSLESTEMTKLVLDIDIGSGKDAANPVDMLEDFYNHLLNKQLIVGDLSARFNIAEARRAGRPLQKLWQLTELSAHGFADEVARFFALPRVSLPELIAAASLADRFSQRFLRESSVFAYSAGAGLSRLVVADPSDAAVVRAAEIVLGNPLEIEVASFEDIATVLAARLEDRATVTDTSDAVLARADDDVESLRDLASGAPVVRAVNDLLERAVELRATDIHLEPFQSGLIVRMRVDGVLRTVPTPADALPQAVISRVKILSGLNIAERRLPQDGAARLHIAGVSVDIRVATMPTQHGESAVIRLLSKDRGLLDIGKLGMASADEERIARLLALPHGMVVITGPTGSGKTTTLATMLNILNDTSRKILTVEDPVEYEIHGINQTQVKPAIGLTFATALRSFLRHDPDVIMVGEVRDAETAHISVHAALTGHLVLTTLHTETAASAMPRLLDLGVEGFLLSSTLRGVIAQRLVRLLCDRCKRPRRLSSEDLAADPRYAALNLKIGETIHEPGGCERCSGTGYRGRNGVFEIIEMNEEIRSLIGTTTNSGEIERAALRGGMTTMLDDAVAKCRAGITSPAEALRVVALR
jgi:general secretion pathway protein E